MKTIAQLLRDSSARFAEAGIEGGARDAKLLLQEATGLAVSSQIAFPERELDDRSAQAFEELVLRRLSREPISRILGRREFWSLPFKVSPATLDPRPDSETLIEAVLARIGEKDKPYRILDLGTGTGCLLLALLKELGRAQGLGIDIQPEAVTVAQHNAEVLGLKNRAEFQVGHWGNNLSTPFDIIVSNPPYIPTADIEGLQPEVALFEPRCALDGGQDGLDAYRVLTPLAQRWMNPGGLLAFEIGRDQARSVADLCVEHGMTNVEIMQDLSRQDRCVICRK